MAPKVENGKMENKRENRTEELAKEAELLLILATPHSTHGVTSKSGIVLRDTWKRDAFRHAGFESCLRD